MPYFKNASGEYIKVDGAYMRDDECCCETPFIPCTSALNFDQADYAIHIQFHSGAYTDLCHNCDKLEASTFVLTWNATHSQWRYSNMTFGDACSQWRELRMSLVGSCGNLGTTGDPDYRFGLGGGGWTDGVNSGTSPDNYLLFWGSDGNCSLVLSLRQSPSFVFPSSEIVLDQWYEAGATISYHEICGIQVGDCKPTTAGVGPQVRYKMVPV